MCAKETTSEQKCVMPCEIGRDLSLKCFLTGLLNAYTRYAIEPPL